MPPTGHPVQDGAKSKFTTNLTAIYICMLLNIQMLLINISSNVSLRLKH